MFFSSLDDYAHRVYSMTIDGNPQAEDDMIQSLAVEHFLKGVRDYTAAVSVVIENLTQSRRYLNMSKVTSITRKHRERLN